MTVREVVLQAARVLELETRIMEYIDDGEDYAEHEAKLLLGCFHAVECNLALNYLPLYAEDTLRTTTGRLEFSAFENSPVKIIGVTDENGDPVQYTLYPKYLKTKVGTMSVTYTYTPSEKTWEEESDFSSLMPDRVLVYGILAEYCLIVGRYDDAAEWDKKYKAEVESVFKKRTCQRLSSRRWV